MNKTMKKALSLALMIVMVLSSVPMSGLALNLVCESSGHSWGTYSVTESATCTKTGKEVAECTRFGCSEKNTRTIVTDPTKHNEISMPRVEATCDKIGNEAGVVCGDCNVVISGYAKIPAKGHTAEALPSKAATCEEDGYTAGTKCKNCPAILTGGDKIEKLGHKWTTYTQTAPDCKTGTPGKKVDICQTCSKLSAEQNIEAKHNFGVWTTTVEATCATEGKKVRRCTITGCNRTDSVEELVIPKLGHIEETIVNYKAATCTEDGVTAGKKCKVCQTVIEESVIIPSLGGHSYQTDWQIIAEPTCTQTGSSIKICQTCLEVQTLTLEKTPHSDANNDNKCDYCQFVLSDTDSKEECMCVCHDNDVGNFIYKILVAIQRLFKVDLLSKVLHIEQYCKCGIAHY